MTHKTKFWLNDPLILISQFSLILDSKECDDVNAKLNVLTRIILIIAGIMYAMEYQYWLYFLGISIFSIFGLKILADSKKEKFTIPATYIDGAEPMTTISPSYSEEWQSPAIYDEYENLPTGSSVNGNKNSCYDYIEERPIFAQFVGPNNLFPYQRTENSQNTLNDNQILMNDFFTNESLKFRNDMSRGHINKLERWYRHGCYDNVTPTNSY